MYPCLPSGTVSIVGETLRFGILWKMIFYLMMLVFQIDGESDGVNDSYFSSKDFAEHLGCQILSKNKLENGGYSINQSMEHSSLKLKWLSSCI